MAIGDDIKELEKLLELKKKQIRLEQDITKQQQLQAEAKAYEKSIKRLKDQEGQLDEIQKKQEKIKGGWDDIGRALGNVPLGQFVTFKDRTEDIASSVKEINDNIDKVVNSINRDFAKADLKIPKPSTKAFQSVISELEAQIPGMGKDLQEALTSGDIGTYYKKYGDEGRKLAIQAMDKKKGFVGVATYFGKDGQGPKDLETFKRGLQDLEKEGKNFRASIDLSGIFGSMRRNILENIGIGEITRRVKEFDNSLSDLKRNFQIPVEDFTDASKSMSELTQKTARFGMSVEDTFATVKGIGDEAKTTNLKTLADITDAVKGVPQATGIALQEVTKISGQMAFFGASSEKIGGAFVKISNQSKIFGVQSSKVAAQFASAYPKFKMMGMKGSEGAIAAMAAQAEKLGINLESAVTSSKNFLDIGEAMESAADLSLLGGAAAQVSFVDLMQARLDPKKMTQLQERLVSDIGRIDSATGELKDLSLSEMTQLEERAKRMGVEYDVLYKRMKGQKEDAFKVRMFDPKEFSSMSEEQKQFLLSKVVSKGGKFEVEGFEGIKDLKSISKETVDAQMKKLGLDKKSLEAQADATKSFDESKKALINSFLNIFNNLQPALQHLTNLIVMLNGWVSSFFEFINKIPFIGTYASAILAAIPVLLLTFGSLKGFGGIIKTAFSGLGGVLSKIPGVGGMFKKKAAETITETVSGGAPDIGGKVGKMPKKGPTFLQQFAKISPAQMLSLAVAIAAVGAAFMMIGKGIEFAANGLSNLVKAFKDTKSAGMALGAVTIVMGSFVGMMAIMIPLVRVLGSVGRTAAPGILAVGAALLMMGAGINLASKGLAVLVEAFGKTQNAGMALAAVTVVVGGFVAAIAVFATMGPAIGTAIGAVGSGIASAVGVLGPALLTFAQLMGTTTPLGPAGLVIVGMALGIALALRIMAPAIAAMGPLLTGLGDMFKGLAPVVEAAGNAIAKIVSAIGDGIVKIIKQVTVSIQQLASINPLQLMGVATGIGAISVALAAFGGGSMLGGIGKAIGDFFGGDPVANLMKFAKIPGDNLVKVSGAIKELASGLKNLEAVNLKGFTSQIDKLGSINSNGFTKLIELSKDSTKAKVAAEALTNIGKQLSVVPTVNLTNVSNLAKTIELIATNVKSGLEKLGDFKGFLQGKAAVSTAQSLSDIAQALNKVPVINASAITALANALGSMGKVTKGIEEMGGGIFGFGSAKQSAIDIAEIAISLNKIPEVKASSLNALASALENISKITEGIEKLSNGFFVFASATKSASDMAEIAISLNKIPEVNVSHLKSLENALGTNIEKIKQGIERLSGGLFGFANAKKGAFDIAAIAKALNSIPEVKITNINSLITVLGPNIEKIKEGIERLSGGLLGFAGAKKGASDIAAIGIKLNSIPFIKLENINSMIIALDTLASKIGPAIDKLKDLKSEGLEKLASIQKFVIPAMLSIISLQKIATIINQITSVKNDGVLTLINVLQNFNASSMQGLIGLAQSSKHADQATIAANKFVALSKALNLIQVSKVDGIKSINETLKGMGFFFDLNLRRLSALNESATSANAAAKTLVSLSGNLNKISNTSSNGIQTLQEALGVIGRNLRNGMRDLAEMTNISRLANATTTNLGILSSYINKIAPTSSTALESLNNTLDAVGRKMKSGLENLSNMTASSKNANSTVLNLISLSQNINKIGTVNQAGAVSLGDVLNKTVGKISNNVRKLSNLLTAVTNATKTVIGLQEISKEINSIPTALSKYLTSLSNVLGQSLKGITKGVNTLASIKSKVTIAVQTTNSLIELANSINAIPITSNFKIRGLSTALIPVPKIRIGLIRLINIQKYVPGAIESIKGLVIVSQNISRIGLISPKPLKTLADTISSTAGALLKGISKYVVISFLMGGAIKTTSGIATIFSSLSTIGNVNQKSVMAALPMLDKLVAHLKKFSMVSDYAPQLVSASQGLMYVASSLEKTGKGFGELTKIPTEGFKNIGDSINGMVNSMASMSTGKNNMVANIQTLATTMSKLGMALREVSIGFTNSAKAMAAFNVQIERMKMNASVAEKGPAPAAKNLGEKAPAAGIPVKEAATAFAGPNMPSEIKIAPIQINLKINGKDVQEMIVDAQYYR